MGGIIGKALAGAGAGAGQANLEAMRAEIMAERDARLNQYAVSMQKDVVQPFQSSESAANRALSEKTHSEALASSEKIHGEALGETSRHNKATEDIARIKADAYKKAAEAKGTTPAKGMLTQKDGIVHVLQPRYGGKMEGGMWFPDEANRDVALRAMEIYEQLTTGATPLPPVEAAKRAAEAAEREQKLGQLPIGKAPAGGIPVDNATQPQTKDFSYLWNPQTAATSDETDDTTPSTDDEEQE